jgi:hypothetical protein
MAIFGFVETFVFCFSNILFSPVIFFFVDELVVGLPKTKSSSLSFCFAESTFWGI